MSIIEDTTVTQHKQQNIYKLSLLSQILVRDYGGLSKIPKLLEVTSLDVRIQALNVINNLAMDADNQAVLRVSKVLN